MEPMVDTEQRLEDSIYAIHGDSFELFMKRIEEALDKPILHDYTKQTPDSAELAWAYYALNFTDSMPNDSLGITHKNCLLLFNKQNQFNFRKPSDERSFGPDQQFNLMQFTNLLRYEGQPAGTHEVNVDTWGRDSSENDSIGKSYRKDFVKRKLGTMALISDVEYLLVVEDRCLKRPRMITKTSYEGGLLVCDTKLIRLKDGQLLAKRTFLVENSGELSHIQQSLNIGMSLVNGSNSILETDLAQRRNRELVEHYNIH